MLLLEALQDPQRVAALIVALILGITVHEFSHAAAATWLGDSLPRYQGRLSLSPAAHLDVMGSLMFIVAGFGWGRPVQYNPYALRASPRAGPAIVAAAGPISNILLAVLLAIPARLIMLLAFSSASAFSPESSLLMTLLYFLRWIVFYNLILSFFNLIPIFPLDGFSILLGLLPPGLADQFEQTRQWGMFVLLALIFLGGSILGTIVYLPVITLTRFLIGI